MVTNYCCCFSLRTAAIISAVASTILSFLSITENIVSVTVPYGLGQTGTEKEARKAMNNAHMSLTIITFHMMIVELVLSALLIYGCSKEKPQFIKPWIYYTMVCLFTIDVALLIYMFIAFVFVGIIAGIAVLVPSVIATMVGAYLIIVVNSYYRELLGMDDAVMASEEP